jgi:chemotaxis protein methyltransferase CheR/two-component system CheB/CheR fusion protein
MKYKNHKPLWVAGIGASAGGLEACQQLMKHVPQQGHMAWILAQHQAVDGHTELLARQLARHSKLEVRVASSGELLQADRLYILPSGQDGSVRDQRIVLNSPTGRHISTPSVDVLFDSIASEVGPRGLGILLSGAGSDGVAGCRAIRSAGGMTLAQDPLSARFSGMPSAAVEAGVIDEVLTLNQLAQRTSDTFSPPSPSAPSQGLREILATVRRVTGIDFAGYKPETLLRRIHSRMGAIGSSRLDHYAAILQQRPAEAQILQAHFLVSLSSFFRDRESFQVLQDHWGPHLASKKAGDSLRIWTPGCASGEETYTLAILLSEVLGAKLAQMPPWIGGTDLNPEAVAKAERGLYPASSLKEVETKLIDRYFRRTGQQYEVREDLRSMCRFNCQDVIGSPAPSQLDLISCRNMLIYLDSEVQGLLMRKFHQALVPEGWFFLGPAETLGLVGNSLFRPVDSHHRIYRRRAV